MPRLTTLILYLVWSMPITSLACNSSQQALPLIPPHDKLKHAVCITHSAGLYNKPMLGTKCS